MCAVIGAFIESPDSAHMSTVAKTFHESGIRGLHATGVSWIKNNEIKTVIEAKPANIFLQSFDLKNCINEDGNLYLIAHCRYSTSDLEYNQPLYNDNISVVHNGVVSQEMPEKWKDLYGYDCKTRNDSELILHTIEAGKSPLKEFPNSSMAVIELYKEKKIRFYRNGKRPIHYTYLENGFIITSTADIAFRAGLGSTMVEMNTYMTIEQGLTISSEKVLLNNKDFQNV